MNPDLADKPTFAHELTGTAPTGKFGIRYPRRPITSDVNVELLGSTTGTGFAPITGATEANPTSLGSDQESILLHDSESMSAAPRKLYRLRITPHEPAP